MTSTRTTASRVLTDAPLALRTLHVLRSLAMRKFLRAFRHIERMLRTDRAFRAFHEGRPGRVPDYYDRIYERKLGRYASVLSKAERTPDLGPGAAPLRLSAPLPAKFPLEPLPQPLF